MNSSQFLLWIFVGVGISVLNFVMQYWSVKMIDPGKYHLSQWLIIGGAIIRWAMIGMILGMALSSSFAALLVVFLTFILCRFVILSTYSRRWEKVQSKMH